MSTMTFLGVFCDDPIAREALFRWLADQQFERCRTDFDDIAPFLGALPPEATWFLALAAGEPDLDRVYRLSAQIDAGGFRPLRLLTRAQVGFCFVDLAGYGSTHREFANIAKMLDFLRDALEAGAPPESLVCRTMAAPADGDGG